MSATPARRFARWTRTRSRARRCTELAAQGIEVDATIPIRVELIENYAVAWFAPDGEPIISRDTIVAIWTVVQRPQAGRLEGGSDAPIAEPDDNTIDTVINTDAYVTLPEGRTIVTEFGVTGAEQTILDFLDRLGTPHEIPALAQLETYHPGCL